MEKLDANKQTIYQTHKAKLQALGPKIKTITEQGRSVENDISQLFLFKGMFKELKPYFDAFNDAWDKLIELTIAEAATSIFPTQQDKSVQQNIERYYYEACAIYEKHMNPTPILATASNLTTQNGSINESRTVRARLPQINLPSFNGNQIEWPLFRDTYRSLIHEEESLSNIEKFLFLVSCLKGPPLALIKGIELQADNYPQAWKLLNDTYDDKRRLANSYLKHVLEFSPIKSRPSAANLKSLLTTVGESIESFKQLKIPNSEDFILLCLVLRCLDPDTRRAFEKQYSQTEFPTCANLIDFIKVEWRSLELTIEETNPPNSKSNFLQSERQHSFSSKKNRHNTTLLAGPNQHNSGNQSKENISNSALSDCPVCKARHTLYQCTQFRKATPSQKLNLLRNWSGCTNCLSQKHPLSKCTSQRRCQACARNHHTWLHVQQGQENFSQTTPAIPSSTSGVVLGTQNHLGEVLLGTTIVEIMDANGDYKKVRAVTDSGSQHSFMTESCSAKLGLVVERSTHNVSGIGQSPLTGMLGKTKCNIRSPIASGLHEDLCIEPIVVRRITGDLPHTPVQSNIQTFYKSYVLADEEFWKPSPIELLLGGDLYYDIITGRPITVAPKLPKLLPTIFGHIVGGPSTSMQTPQMTSSLLVNSLDEMKEIMSKFWEVEEVSCQPMVSKEETMCEDHFLATHRRMPSGRYIVSLPLKESIKGLTNPKQQAFNRLLHLENKLSKDPELKDEYHTFMKDYLILGHMKLAPPNTSAYTIPHHAVLKSQNGQRKLRVVFDASCRTNSGSLNDHMFAGPKLQLDIGDVISNFRIHQVVFTADIVKMYRQILVEPSDRTYQHILWRFKSSEIVQDFELCTVTYGEKASAFLAQRTIKQLINDEGSPYPLAARALLEDIYVDDIATGAQTSNEAIQLRDDIVALLAKGGFHLSKWASNCPELLSTLPESEIGSSCISLTDDIDSRIKVLGIQWNPKEDIFSYEICAPPWNPTKRAILSAIARVYDPLGYLAPVIFFVKAVLQQMWIAKLDWDDPAPPDICSKWHSFLSQLHLLSQLKIPRCLTMIEATLHRIVGFSDASQRGYSAVLYVQAITSTDCRVSLLKAKTKLAPIKPMTIPRLELCGTLLLSRLFRSCKAFRDKLNVTSANFFTDSRVVLGWLSTPPESLNIFVAHRVVEILEHTVKEQWSFISSGENPADCSSRGILPSELLSHPLWWKGPSWLSFPMAHWPTTITERPVDLPEMKQKQVTSLTATDSPTVFLDWMERFSSYPKLVRSTAYVLRFIEKLRSKNKPQGPISSVEYRNAGKLLLRLVQNRYKTSNNTITPHKSLKSLRPFIDAEGFVRVGGRLHQAQLPYDAKHPYLLPADSHFTKILVDHYHVSYLHLGPSALRAMLQVKFWIVGARGVIRQRIFHCIKCYKFRQSPHMPIMGNLPSFRLEEGSVFAHVGVDLAGPFYIRESLRRKAALGKAYLCLFVCMATKAVHLEVVSKCTTDAFLAALTRFTARRGKPTHIYSDCGTNFIGAANRLKDIILCLRSDESKETILQHLAPQEIQWSFNPPSAPHFGGLWEAGIKSCKSILYKVIGEAALTFEELATLFCEIEGILNSRPLAPLGTDPDSADCLTPGHLLIGKPLTAIPEEKLPDKLSTLQRWKLIQQKTQHFWTRWRMEYLNTLQQRKKWNKESPNMKVGDLVIIKEPNTTLKTWPLARIIETHSGKDNVVRVVTLRTPTGNFKRPVAKLVPLDPIN